MIAWWKKRKGKILTLKKDTNWRLQTRLYKQWKVKLFLVHRLVAYTFIWDVSWKVVDHIDDDYTNNQVWNLQILTQKENMIKREIKTNDIEKIWKYAYTIKHLEYDDFIKLLKSYKF